MKILQGKTIKSNPCIGKITFNENVFPRQNYILVTENPKNYHIGFAGYILLDTQKTPIFTKSAISITKENIKNINENDIVELDHNTIIFLWETTSQDNVFFITETCNSNCIMCPQPPRKDRKNYYKQCLKILNLLDPEQLNTVCITGGEPTLNKKNFIHLLQEIYKKNPYATINILTNAQAFKDNNYVNEIYTISQNKKIKFCISFLADSDSLTNTIARTNHFALDNYMGIINLAQKGFFIELRFVISKLNYHRLPYLADYFIRNTPFANHIAIMGLEMTGYAFDNQNEVWIDPITYQNELSLFVEQAKMRNLPFSIYNLPLCLLPDNAKKYAQKSISKWKEGYIKKCQTCPYKIECCGIFTTSKIHSSKL